jgi:hypothetical protein
MSLEILALFAILLHKAQKALSPITAANDAQKAANDRDPHTSLYPVCVDLKCIRTERKERCSSEQKSSQR